MTELQDGQQTSVPINAIRIKTGFNPRTYLDDAELSALADSVKEDGVVQPVLVRPVENYSPDAPSFWMIAGERRYRAAKAAKLTFIPAVIRLVDEKKALLLAELENNPRLRIGISLAEEARLAQRIVGECDGDREEAAKLLRWSPTTLASRLLLLHCSKAVLASLTRREIRLGHAELLARLPQETQDGTLQAIMKDSITVAELRKKIDSFALVLDSAIFDKTDCGQCPHNSSCQTELFSENISQGRCQNRACFGEKTQQALAVKKAALAETYPLVFLDSERAADSYIPLSKHGKLGVGAKQFNACQGCQHFAALLVTEPGKEGQVEAPICANLPCHTEKVEAYQATTQATAKATPPATGTATTANKTASAKSKAENGVAASPKKVSEYVDSFFRTLAAQRVAENPELMRAWLLYAVIADAQHPSTVLDAYDIPPHAQRATVISKLYTLPTEQKQKLLTELVGYLVQEHSGSYGNTGLVDAAVASVAISNATLTGQFTLDQAFLEANTKAGIESLLSEARNPEGEDFKSWWNAHHVAGKKPGAAFSRLMKGKVTDIIQSILSSTFDFSQWVPNCIEQRLTMTQATLPQNQVSPSKSATSTGATS